MRLAVVTNYYPDQRPLSEYGYHLVRGLKKARPEAEVIVLASSPGPKDVWRPWGYGQSNLPLQLLAALRDLRPDGVLINCLFTSWGDTHLANLLGFLTFPFVARKWFTIGLVHHLPQTIRADRVGYRVTPLHRLGIEVACKALAKAHWVCFALEKDRKFFAQRYRHRRTLRVEHGLLGEPSWAPLSQGELVFLCLGKWGKGKDPEPVILAILQNVKGRLMVAGQSHPRSRRFLERMAVRYSSHRVSFPGYIREEAITALFHQAHLVVLPYIENTGASGVAYQACQYGRALVARDTPFFRELARELGLAIHFYASDDELSGLLRGLMEDRERLEKEGIHNLKMVEHLRMERIAETYWNLLEERNG